MTDSTKIDYVSIVQDLRDEADLCRNETATDIADLLDDAASCIVAMKSQFTALRSELAAAQERNTQLVKALDDMYGTPCEQIRHQQELQAAQEARQAAEAELVTMTQMAGANHAAWKRAEARAESYKAELRNIADADYRKWDEGMRDPQSFVDWAKSRARAAIAEGK